MKVAIVNAKNETAPAPLIAEVLAHIHKMRPATSGTLEVVSATPKNIDIAVTGVTIDPTYGISVSTVLANIIADVTGYVNNIQIDATEVPYVGVVKTVIRVKGVANYTNLTINGATASIPITGIEIPKANNIIAKV